MPISHNCPNNTKNLFNFRKRYTVLASSGRSSWGSNPVWVNWMRKPLGRTIDTLLSKVGNTFVRNEFAYCADREA